MRGNQRGNTRGVEKNRVLVQCSWASARHTVTDRMCVPKRTVDCFAVYPPEPVAFTFTVSAKGLLKAGRNGGVRL
jgi:hypothetical protein